VRAHVRVCSHYLDVHTAFGLSAREGNDPVWTQPPPHTPFDSPGLLTSTLLSLAVSSTPPFPEPSLTLPCPPNPLPRRQGFKRVFLSSDGTRTLEIESYQMKRGCSFSFGHSAVESYVSSAPTIFLYLSYLYFGHPPSPSTSLL
jgi:hypothetical protein